MREGTAGILGTGLIGASIGLGLTAAGWNVVGWDPNPASLHAAHERGAVARMAASETDLVSEDLDLLVLAGPPKAVPVTLRSLSTDVLVTDVTGVKIPVITAGAHLPHFVPGHPMAGRELSGPDAATPVLFRGATWILITDGADPDDMERVEEIVRHLGANPVRMSAGEHDRAIAVVSHLPQLLASTLIAEAAAEIGDLSLVGGGFRDLTRVAASDAALWSELLAANRQLAIETIERFGRRLQRWADLLETESHREVTAALTEAGRLQEDLHAAVSTVEVSLLDRPGELAAVGRALEHSRVDVRDMQLRHAPHGGGGLLKVFVRNGDIPALCRALNAETLTVARIRGNGQ
ncbi:MAG: prephenate dehydrogenase/arogenate dehydrogenase family protein [Gammaproteobacteria bacterium]|nr:prephenate dehydrogenase/arogenate dehydrogenase family protein [Gammaproteobacteria bacterium]